MVLVIEFGLSVSLHCPRLSVAINGAPVQSTGFIVPYVSASGIIFSCFLREPKGLWCSSLGPQDGLHGF